MFDRGGRRALPVPVCSSVQDLTVYDLQLRKVLTPTSALRFEVPALYGKAIESRIHQDIACLNWNSY